MIKLVYPEFWSKKGVLSYILIPFSYIYIFLGILRKLFVKPIRLKSKVICVGNISVGGTGKTQVVLWLAKQFIRKKVNFLVITKGYGSSLRGAKYVEISDEALQVGDESVLLRDYAPVIAAKNVKAAMPLIQKINPDVIIFDDGLQNPGFFKDLRILVIDANRGIGNGRILPSGPLRENASVAIHDSDIIIMIGNNQCQDRVLIDNIDSSDKPFFKAKIELCCELNLDKKYYAFSAIGNNNRFYKLLEENGVILDKIKSFPDHHNYTQEEINILKSEAKKKNLSLITTQKDYVKIKDKDQIISATIKLDFDYGNKLLKLIDEELHKKS